MEADLTDLLDRAAVHDAGVPDPRALRRRVDRRRRMQTAVVAALIVVVVTVPAAMVFTRDNAPVVLDQPVAPTSDPAAPASVPPVEDASETIGADVPAGWEEVRVGGAVIAVPATWRVVEDADPAWHAFDCGDRREPTLRITSGFAATMCPLTLDDAPRRTEPAVTVVRLDAQFLSATAAEFTNEGTSQRDVNGLGVYVRTEAGRDDVLIPEMGMYLRGEHGDDGSAVVERVLGSVRAAADAPEAEERAPFVTSDAQGVWWWTHDGRQLIDTPSAGLVAGAPRLAPTSSASRFVVAVATYHADAPSDTADLRPQELRVIPVIDGVPLDPWVTTVTPAYADNVSGLALGGTPVWSPDGHHLAYTDVIDRNATLITIGWHNVPGVGPPDTIVNVQPRLPVPSEPILHELGSWIWDDEGTTPQPRAGRILFNPTLDGPLRNIWLHVTRDADGTLALPNPTLRAA